MNPADLEAIYERLAERLDAVPAAKRELFLAKLVLLMAHANGGLQANLAMIDDAQSNLDT